jgi:hypothetical protein
VLALGAVDLLLDVVTRDRVHVVLELDREHAVAARRGLSHRTECGACDDEQEKKAPHKSRFHS